MRIERRNRSARRKRAPVPLCPPQIPQDLTPGSNPGLRGGKPATNRLSYGTAATFNVTVMGCWLRMRGHLTLLSLDPNTWTLYTEVCGGCRYITVSNSFSTHETTT
jgi:hypothetical protein